MSTESFRRGLNKAARRHYLRAGALGLFGAVLLGHMRIAHWIATPDVLADVGPDE